MTYIFAVRYPKTHSSGFEFKDVQPWLNPGSAFRLLSTLSSLVVMKLCWGLVLIQMTVTSSGSPRPIDFPAFTAGWILFRCWPFDLSFFFFLSFILSMGKRRSAQTAWMLTSLTLTSRSWTPVILTQWTASASCIGATSTQISPLHPYSTAPETQSYLRWEPSSAHLDFSDEWYLIRKLLLLIRGAMKSQFGSISVQ